MLATDAAAWEADEFRERCRSGSSMRRTTRITLAKTIHVENYGSSPMESEVGLQHSQRPRMRSGRSFQASRNRIASSPSTPGDSNRFDLTLTINASLLDEWYGDSGDLGADPLWLPDLEFDG